MVHYVPRGMHGFAMLTGGGGVSFLPQVCAPTASPASTPASTRRCPPSASALVPSSPSPSSSNPITTSTPISWGDISSFTKRDVGQKADGASVPTDLWDFAFRKGWDKVAGVDSNLAELDLDRYKPFGPSSLDWTQALNVFRKFAMCKLRSMLQKSWWEWARNFITQEEPTGCGVHWTKSFNHKSQAWEHHYAWTKRGKTEHITWSRKRRRIKSLKASWDPALECLQRAADADWWEWLAGSRLFFWRWPAADVE